MWGLAHTYTPHARVAYAGPSDTGPRRRTGSGVAQAYRSCTCGDTVGATGRGRGAPAEMTTSSLPTECRMADWAGTHEVSTPAVESTTMDPFVRQVPR